MNPAYRDIVLSRVRGAVEQANALNGVAHRGLRGTLREVLIRDIFRPLLPPDIGAGTGEVISFTGQRSSQQDVIIFNKRLLPPVLFEGVSGVFPSESVMYAIEVKSTLTKAGMKQAHNSASRLAEFVYLPGQYDEQDRPIDHELQRLVPAVFAFDSDLSRSGQTEIQRYDQIRGASDPNVRVLCVVGKGYWWWSEPDRAWLTLDLGYPLSEVIAFLSGVLNSIAKISASRLSPRLGNYLI